VVRAQPHAAGAHDPPPAEDALGRRKGGLRTNSPSRAAGGGQPLPVVLPAGQRHDAVLVDPLMEPGAGQRIGRGRPRRRPRRGVGEKGASRRKIRAALRSQPIRSPIPRQQNERRTGPFDRAIERTRTRVERLINRRKPARRIATRYEKCAVY